MGDGSSSSRSVRRRQRRRLPLLGTAVAAILVLLDTAPLAAGDAPKQGKPQVSEALSRVCVSDWCMCGFVQSSESYRIDLQVDWCCCCCRCRSHISFSFVQVWDGGAWHEFDEEIHHDEPRPCVLSPYVADSTQSISIDSK